MGEVHVRITIVNPRSGARSDDIAVLADTGATLTIIPAPLLEAVGIEKTLSVTLIYADGRRVRRDAGDAVILVNGESTPCRIVFGEASDVALLGLTVLETLGLAVDPVQRRLVPTDFLAMMGS
jgi:predicted aspartyl protease